MGSRRPRQRLCGTSSATRQPAVVWSSEILPCTRDHAPVLRSIQHGLQHQEPQGNGLRKLPFACLNALPGICFVARLLPACIQPATKAFLLASCPLSSHHLPLLSRVSSLLPPWLRLLLINRLLLLLCPRRQPRASRPAAVVRSPSFRCAAFRRHTASARCKKPMAAGSTRRLCCFLSVSLRHASPAHSIAVYAPLLRRPATRRR